jgi:hypothetical protein
MRRAADLLTGDLFAIPAPATPSIGGLDVGLRLRHLLSDLLKDSVLSRFQVAARMSELTGHEISKHQLDSWTAESREGWRFPLEYLPALEVALETHAVTAWVAHLRGCTMLVGKEALLAELGRVERAKQDLLGREKTIKRLLGEDK